MIFSLKSLCKHVNSLSLAEHKFKIWIFWWEAVTHLHQSFPLGLLAAPATTWASLMRHSRTVGDLIMLPGSRKRVFTDTSQTTKTWEIDQSITTTAIIE